MVLIRVGKREYNYTDKAMESNLIDKKLKEDFSRYCKEKAIHKSKLIEEVIKTIVLRFRDNSLNEANTYVTVDLKRCTIGKSK